LSLGGSLALQRLDRRAAVAACLITGAKLAVYPLLVWLILGRMMQIDAFWVNVGVLIASLPSAGNIYVLAQRYDVDPQRVSAAGLRRDSSVHACQRGELSVRGLARARLKRVAIRANVNGGLKASPWIRCKMYGIGLLA
jgi:auxin efflux family transporter